MPDELTPERIEQTSAWLGVFRDARLHGMVNVSSQSLAEAADVVDALASAVARARREALEEAAREADREKSRRGPFATEALIKVAGRIRALADSPPETRQTETGWRPMDGAPKKGPILAVVEGAVRIVAYGKTSHVPLYGWVLADQGPEDADLCEPECWQPIPMPPNSPAPAIANLDGEGRS